VPRYRVLVAILLATAMLPQLVVLTRHRAVGAPLRALLAHLRRRQALYLEHPRIFRREGVFPEGARLLLWRPSLHCRPPQPWPALQRPRKLRLLELASQL
jgi:hypothetical protein